MKVLSAGSRVYFLAICGTGMSALASLMKAKGFVVGGSDTAAYPPVGDFLKQEGIPVDLGFEKEKVEAFRPDYVVIGNFVRRDNPQAQWVLERGIPYGSFPSTMEDYFLDKTRNFVVVGTHGKSTTTTCLSYLLDACGRSPSFLVGAIPKNFESSARLGSGQDFVIEGDEYDTAFFDKESKFLHYRPMVALMLSLEWDHADIFPNPEKMELMFRKFIQKVDPKGIIFHCADWPRIQEILSEEKPTVKQVSFGFSAKAENRIMDFQESAKGMTFSLLGHKFESTMTGRFNAQNFAAAILAAHWSGISLEHLSKALPGFEGLKRRQEIRGRVGEHLVIDDFAHHPTAVREVIAGVQAQYPHHKVAVFFEPRSNTSRRAVLQKLFNEAFVGADTVLLAPVFKSEALPENDRLNIGQILENVKRAGKEGFGPLSVSEMAEKAQELARKNPTAFLVLSNGSFEGLHEKLLSALKTV